MENEADHRRSSHWTTKGKREDLIGSAVRFSSPLVKQYQFAVKNDKGELNRKNLCRRAIQKKLQNKWVEDEDEDERIEAKMKKLDTEKSK